MSTCWICGGVADSGEHLIKVSDLRTVFGIGPKGKSPLYIHTKNDPNRLAQGLKSDHLKYKARLCSRCNNQLTQPHDRAWERLSSYLQQREPPIYPGLELKLEKVFPGSVRNSMLDVHLFFLKHFGCIIVENDIPMDIAPFADAIRQRKPHPHVHLAIWSGRRKADPRHVGHTHVQAVERYGRVRFAAWLYVVDRAAVNVIYAAPGEHRKALTHAWHPCNVGKRIRVVGE